jgi:hypothetical protein
MKMMPKKLAKDHQQQKREVYADFLQQIKENDKWQKSHCCGWKLGFSVCPWDSVA